MDLAPKKLSISPKDSLEHTHIIGPTGSGKSTVMQHLILADIKAGRLVSSFTDSRSGKCHGTWALLIFSGFSDSSRIRTLQVVLGRGFAPSPVPADLSDPHATWLEVILGSVSNGAVDARCESTSHTVSSLYGRCHLTSRQTMSDSCCFLIAHSFLFLQ